MDPRERSVVYLLEAEDLVQQARIELGMSNVRQAAEKTWGAAALAQGLCLLEGGQEAREPRGAWEYVEVLASELGG